MRRSGIYSTASIDSFKWAWIWNDRNDSTAVHFVWTAEWVYRGFGERGAILLSEEFQHRSRKWLFVWRSLKQIIQRTTCVINCSPRIFILARMGLIFSFQNVLTGNKNRVPLRNLSQVNARILKARSSKNVACCFPVYWNWPRFARTERMSHQINKKFHKTAGISDGRLGITGREGRA